ncbi:MAG: VOC family protein [Proteobacteria bacterium]|nr:MAG: VOC family protein [Pseudomonadota bacterium]
MYPQPLIAVSDVEASSRWYRQLLGCQSGHGGNEYEQLLSGGRMVLQLHRWDAHEHPFMGDPDSRPYGNGVLLWFQTDAFDAAVARARELEAQILEEPHVNRRASHRECWLRDPDGYVVVLASAHGDVREQAVRIGASG